MRELTKEDGVYENAGAILFLVAAIAFFILTIRPNFYTNSGQTGPFPERKYFWLFTLVFLFAFGEEISWGQRIFNFATPESIREINVQEEFNVHNLEIFHGKSRSGEDKTGLMAWITLHRLFYLTFLTYLLIIPLLARMSSRIRFLIDKIKLPTPDILIGILFAFNLLYGQGMKAISSGLDGHGIVEIKEFVVAFILCALPFSWLQIGSKSDK